MVGDPTGEGILIVDYSIIRDSLMRHCGLKISSGLLMAAHQNQIHLLS